MWETEAHDEKIQMIVARYDVDGVACNDEGFQWLSSVLFVLFLLLIGVLIGNYR